MTETPKTETPSAPYDLASVLESVNTQNLIFVGRDSAEFLAKQADSVVSTKQGTAMVTFDVVMFPYSLNDKGDAEIAAGPRRGSYTGNLQSILLNERKSKGQFIFSDGTIIHRDSVILE